MVKNVQYGPVTSSVQMWHIFSAVEGVQDRPVTPSVWWRVRSTDLSHHQQGKGVQYRTAKTAQGVVDGCINLEKVIFCRQSYLKLQSGTKLNEKPSRMAEKRLFLPPFPLSMLQLCCQELKIHVDQQH